MDRFTDGSVKIKRQIVGPVLCNNFGALGYMMDGM